jgi:uncharacterized OB-fold protein
MDRDVSRPGPIVTDDSAIFWDAAAAGRLVAQACADCGRLRHPPRPMCPHCGSLHHEARELSGLGTVYSYSFLHHPQHLAFEYPVVAALVDLDEGIRLVTNLVEIEHDDVAIGLRVQVTYAPTADGTQVPVFQPAEAR